ncbi:MAG: hypothetical protein IJT36_04705 [Alphaproteobacteria bacterium]|nr:hypothetical protein [Alphaproteobacteria bacterium]
MVDLTISSNEQNKLLQKLEKGKQHSDCQKNSLNHRKRISFKNNFTMVILCLSMFLGEIQFIYKLISYLYKISDTILISVLQYQKKLFSILSSIYYKKNIEIKKRKEHSGYVLIVVTCFIPIVLLGIRYAEKLFEVKDSEIRYTSENRDMKKCAREAALAVARNWNPGLTLGQQRDGIYKIADAVYNSYPAGNKSVLGNAVPGVIIHDKNGNVIDFTPKTINYKTDNAKYIRGWYVTVYNNGSLWNVPYGMWRGIDVSTEPSNRLSQFDELDAQKLTNGNFVLNHQDIFQQPHPRYLMMSSPSYPSDKYYNGNSRVMYFSPGTTASEPCSQYLITDDARDSYGVNQNTTELDGTYSSRLSPSGTDYVEVSVVDDKINVRTDTQQGYAIPAQCNVDVVLAVPVNGAASNIDNKDLASDTAGTPYSHDVQNYIPDNAKKTPIYQMGQALKAFVKEHFYHTRGVNMSLIPYSGKLSIPPNRATTWTVPFPQFTDTSTNTQLMIGACLYGTSGVKDANLKQPYKTTALVSGATLPTTNTPYYWGGVLTGCPIMFRAGMENLSTSHGNNKYYSGFMLYTDDPSKGNSYKYFRMNLNPCYMGYANMLSMKCDRACTHFLPNPYYIIEPTADLVKIYEMCNALYPIYDIHNVSNFIFLPLEWANNMFQSWTKNPEIIAKNGSGAGTAGATSDATLSRPSKTTSGRKKAIILLVNKPDWFEPGEMTYLGFDNDFSEIPMAESDKIDFSINYTDTSKKFLDGTAYDGTIAGPKKIIRYQRISGNIARNSSTGIFEDTGTSKIRLKIPKPATVKLTLVSANKIISPNWAYYPNALNPSGSTSRRSYWGSYTGSTSYYSSLMTYGGGKFCILNSYQYYQSAAYSTDGIKWIRVTLPKPSSSNYWEGFAYNGNNFVALGTYGWITYSSDCDSWSNVSQISTFSSLRFYNGGIVWNGSEWLTFNTNNKCYTSTSINGSSGWTLLGSSPNLSTYQDIAYGGNYYVQYYYGQVRYSTDGLSWSSTITLPTRKYGHITYGNGYFVVICSDGNIIYASDPTSASNWSYMDSTTAEHSSLYNASLNSSWCTICYGDGKWVACTSQGDVAVSKARGSTSSTASTLQFTNVGDSNVYSITDKKTFTIDANNITNTDGTDYILDFTVTNMELIAAEVSNLIMDDVTPKKVTYRESDVINSNQSGNVLSWGTRQVTKTAGDIINFSAGNKSGSLLTYNDTSNALIYTSNCGYDTPVDTTVKGRITLSCKPESNLTINVTRPFAGNVWENQGSNIPSHYSSWGDGSGGSAYTNSHFIRMRQDGKIYRSSNGIGAWDYISSLTSRSWDSMAYGNNTLIALSRYGYVSYSINNGTTWTDVTGTPLSGYTDEWFGNLTYGNGKFLAIDKYGNVATSTDGKSNWSVKRYNASEAGNIGSIGSSWYGAVCYGNNRFVSLGSDGKTAYSSDGNYWTQGGTLSGGGRWYGITFGNGIFFALSYSGYTARSSDGSSWSTPENSLGSISSYYWFNISFGNGKFVAMNQNGYVATYTYAENNLNSSLQINSETSRTISGTTTVTVTPSQWTKSGSNYYIDLTMKNLRLVSASVTSVVKTVKTLRSTINTENIVLVVEKSSDLPAVEWRSIENHNWKGITYGNNKFLAVGNGYVGISSDGASWEYTSISYTFSCVDFDSASSTFFASTSAGAIYSSSNGTSWTSHSTAPISSVYRIACGNGYIVVQNTSYSAASYDKSTGSWSASTRIPANNTTYALCFGNGKFISIPYAAWSPSQVYASTNGLSWTNIGSGLMTEGGFEGAVCYGDGKFVSVDDFDYAAYSTDGGVTWSRADCDIGYGYIVDICYANGSFYCIGSSTNFGPITLVNNNIKYTMTLGNRQKQEIDGRKTFIISPSELQYDSSIGRYCIDLDLENVVCKKAAISYNKDDTVYDMIDFNTNTSAKNGVLTANFNGTYNNGYYELSSSGRISTPHRGSLIFKYAGVFSNDTGYSTSTIQKTSLSNSGGLYYYNWGSNSYMLLNVKFDFESTLWYPYNLMNTQTLDWRNNNMSIPSGIGISSYSNYNSTEGYHRLKTNACSPFMYRRYSSGYHSDITAVLNAQKSILTNFTLPDYSYTAGDTYISGVVRLFSPQKRDSAKNYCELKPYSDAYDDKVNLLATSFTYPMNTVLSKQGYQSANETPIHAVSDLTAAACTKLKTTYGNNLRIYLIKYRAQSAYSTFPYYDRNPIATSHNYSIVDACATPGYVYSASDQDTLKNKLDEIAADIKNWVGYEDAKNVIN